MRIVAAWLATWLLLAAPPAGGAEPPGVDARAPATSDAAAAAGATLPPRRTATRASAGREARPKPGPAGMPPRTLREVHIEGEIPAPQVLFVTARDQRRILEFRHRRYLRTAAGLAAATPFPTWIGVTEVAEH